jgi:hypothetical protein
MNPPILLDESLWPLLVTRFTGSSTDMQFEAYLARTTALLQRRERHLCILDAIHGGMPTTFQRNRQVEWIRQNEELLRDFTLGHAYVMQSPMHRLALSTVLHLKPLPTTHVIVPDLGAAVTWALGRLREAGLELSAERVWSHLGLGPGKRGG